MSLLWNFHTHTDFCDGRDTAEDMVKQALALGFKGLGFSGHMDPDIHMDMEKYTAEIYRLQEKYHNEIEILCGVELDTLYDPASARGAEYLIGSTHFLDVPSETPMSVDSSEAHMKKLCREFFGGDYYKLSKAYYDLESQVYDRLHCTFIGHVDLVTRFNDSMHFLDENDPRYWKPALLAMEYLVSQDVPFEINCGAVNRNSKKEFYPNHFLLKNLQKMGGQILINSDAHQKELLNGAFDLAVKEAIACGFTHVIVLRKNERGHIYYHQAALDSL